MKATGSTMTDGTVRATRVCKARDTRGVCGYCGGPIIAGQQIGLVHGEGWQHARCIARQQPSYWSAIYGADDAERERRRAIDADRALAFLRSVGRRI